MNKRADAFPTIDSQTPGAESRSEFVTSDSSGADFHEKDQDPTRPKFRQKEIPPEGTAADLVDNHTLAEPGPNTPYFREVLSSTHSLINTMKKTALSIDDLVIIKDFPNNPGNVSGEFEVETDGKTETRYSVNFRYPNAELFLANELTKITEEKAVPGGEKKEAFQTGAVVVEGKRFGTFVSASGTDAIVHFSDTDEVATVEVANLKKAMVDHGSECPYPKQLSNGEQVIDEACSCGHPITEHFDSIQYGHGSCSNCSCPQFTWTGFITKPGGGSKKRQADLWNQGSAAEIIIKALQAGKYRQGADKLLVQGDTLNYYHMGELVAYGNIRTGDVEVDESKKKLSMALNRKVHLFEKAFPQAIQKHQAGQANDLPNVAPVAKEPLQTQVATPPQVQIATARAAQAAVETNEQIKKRQVPTTEDWSYLCPKCGTTNHPASGADFTVDPAVKMLSERSVCYNCGAPIPKKSASSDAQVKREKKEAVSQEELELMQVQLRKAGIKVEGNVEQQYIEYIKGAVV